MEVAMPVMRDKTSLNSLNITNAPHQTEQKISTNILSQRFSLKDTPLSRLTRIKTEIDYYHLKAVGNNNYVINIDNLSSTDPNTPCKYCYGLSLYKPIWKVTRAQYSQER
jgi:hypothetical protein